PRDVADAIEVGDGGAAEFHDQTWHRGSRTCEKQLTSGRRRASPGAAAEKARIHNGAAAALQHSELRGWQDPAGCEGNRMVTRMASSSVDPREVEQFARMATTWWDPRGPMAPLHKLNPVRLAYIRDRAAERFGRDPKLLGCLKGLRMLDIGCGAGILSEPLARLGADLVGVDPAA